MKHTISYQQNKYVYNLYVTQRREWFGIQISSFCFCIYCLLVRFLETIFSMHFCPYKSVVTFLFSLAHIKYIYICMCIVYILDWYNLKTSSNINFKWNAKWSKMKGKKGSLKTVCEKWTFLNTWIYKLQNANNTLLNKE